VTGECACLSLVACEPSGLVFSFYAYPYFSRLKGYFDLRNPPLSRVLRSQDEDFIERVISEESKRLPEGVYLDLGAHLPPHYGVDRLQLMVQSPFRIFAYWELTESLIEEGLECFPPEDRPLFRPVLKWFEVGGSHAQFFDIGTTTHWWFGTAPEKEYQAQLCLYSEDYGLFPLLSSNVVITPPFSLGPAPEKSQEEPETLPLLESLLHLAGIGSPEEESRPEKAVLALGTLHVSRAEAPEMESKPSETQAQRPEIIIEQASSEQTGIRGEEESRTRADEEMRWSIVAPATLDRRPTSPGRGVRN
jgi:hypothetical protein